MLKDWRFSLLPMVQFLIPNSVPTAASVSTNWSDFSLSLLADRKEGQTSGCLAGDSRSILAGTQPDPTCSLLAGSCDPFFEHIFRPCMM